VFGTQGFLNARHIQRSMGNQLLAFVEAFAHGISIGFEMLNTAKSKLWKPGPCRLACTD
jgi:hypothetical protein